MSNPIDAVAVCNLALDHLKQAPVVNIEDPTTTTEELLARQYPQARRASLRAHPWNFASHRAAITPASGAEPVVGYTRAYKKPTDFIRFLYRMDSTGAPVTTEYDLEGDYILMDGDASSTIYIRYTRDITDPGKFDPLFIDYLALNLAIRIASKFSGGEARTKSLEAMLNRVKADATAIDGQERPPRKRDRSAFLSARRGYGVQRSGDQRYTYFS